MRRLFCVTLLTLSVIAQAADYVTIQKDVAPGAERITVSLNANPSQSGGGSSPQELKSELIPEGKFSQFRERGYSQYMSLGAQADGASYYALIRVPTDLKWISRQSQPPIDVLLFRGDFAKEEATDKVAEGMIVQGNQTEIPLRRQISPVGANKVSEVQGTLYFNVYGSSGSQLTGNAYSRWNLELQGSSLLKNSKVTVSLNPLQNPVVSPNQPISVRFDPLEASLPTRQAAGKLGDVLDAGPGKLVVEKVAADYSEIVLAVVHGSLQTIEKSEVQLVSNLPSLAQVDLLNRRLVTGDDLLSAAKANDSQLVLIFGDFKPEATPYYHGDPTQQGWISLSAQGVLDLLTRETGRPPVVAFAVRQVALQSLYDEWLGRPAPFLLLSDFADPLQVTFRAPARSDGYYPPPMPMMGRGPAGSLRRLLGLPEGKVSVVAFDVTGKLRYAKPDVGDNLRGILVETGKVLAGKISWSQTSAAETTGTASQN